MRHRYRILTTIAVAVAALAAGLVTPSPLALDGPLLDALVWARAAVSSASEGAPAPVVVVAVDERSLESPELAGSPRALFAPVWATLIEALAGAGVRAVGFDLLFTYTANRLSPDHDRPFLQMLTTHRDRIVLARSSRALPAPPFLAAVDADAHSLGLAEIATDADGVSRHARRAYRTESGDEMPTLVTAVLGRAGHAGMPETVLLAPREHPEALPTYALVDVLRCATQSPAALARTFGGRIVLVGSTLPDEDRKLSSARFLSPALPGAALDPCGLRPVGASRPASASVPGVHLHAIALDAVVRGRLTRTVPSPLVAGAAGLVAALSALVALTQSPWRTTALVAAAGAGLFGIAIAALIREVWIPLALPLAALVAAPAVAYVVRYLVEERTRRRIERAFGRYLSPHVVEQLATSSDALRLGGERRDVTVMFADLSGFTALSTSVAPEVLTRLTNEYLAYIVGAVEATGGYVDKFIGDAVMAIWGAPGVDDDHAAHAVRGALLAAQSIERARRGAEARGERAFAVKIGLNSGPAIVGNVGTERRYNYTAVGETVNVASRLESVPTSYGCAVVVAEHTATLARPAIVFRELDHIRVKGRDEPLTIFEPLGEGTPDAATLARKDGYEAALRDYRAMRFAVAAAAWSSLGGDGDGVAMLMAARARSLALNPPPPSWDGVWTFVNK